MERLKASKDELAIDIPFSPELIARLEKMVELQKE